MTMSNLIRRSLTLTACALSLTASVSHAQQAAMCMTPVPQISCPMMMSLPDGSPCFCSGAPGLMGQVISRGTQSASPGTRSNTRSTSASRTRQVKAACRAEADGDQDAYEECLERAGL